MKRRNRPNSSAGSPTPRPDSAAALRVFGPKDWLFIVALSAAVILVYQPVWHGGFLWDDDLHLLNNPVLKPGGLLKTWVPGTYINYWPLTFTAYRLQFAIWGLNPIGFHIVNIVLHAISAILVWRILVYLKAPGAMFAAALFAIHPVNVESVAWIAQLKNVLSLLLALLSVLLYLRYEEGGKRWCFLWSIGVFFLSALAKGMAVTLPVVLLACAWWQRGRITRRDLLQVVPYLLIGVLMAGVEVWSQHLVAGGGDPVRSDGFLSRAAIAGCAVWFYLGKLIWPANLIFVYPRWTIDERNVLSYVPGVLLVVILALGWWQRRGWGRPVVMLMVCYVGLLLPALGFVNIYFMEYSLVADHWQYAAMIGPCAMFAAAAATLLVRGRQWNRPGGYAACLVVLAILASLTWQQTGMYADAETLYRTTIAKNPQCWLACNNLGNVLRDRGQTNEAIAYYKKALEIKPTYELAYNNLGNALSAQGRVDEAIAEYRKALKVKPDCTTAHYNLGVALSGRGQMDDAIAEYRKALDIDPNLSYIHNNLGLALHDRGQCDDAIAHYRKALEIDPENTSAYNNLGNALLESGQVQEAIVQFRKALEISPRTAEFHFNLALAWTKQGQFDEMAAEYHKVLEIDPDDVRVHNNFGAALLGCGRFDEAIVHFQRALKLKPDFASARHNLDIARSEREGLAKTLAGRRESLRSRPEDVTLLNDTAWLLATNPNASIRNGNEAVELAQRAVRLSEGREPAILGTLAAAYAEAGRFPEALETARKAGEFAQEQNKQSLAESIKAKIPLYEAGVPFRQIAQPPRSGSSQP